MTPQRKAECIRLARERTLAMWMDRRAKEDAEGISNRLTEARRRREDEIIATWNLEVAA